MKHKKKTLLEKLNKKGILNLYIYKTTTEHSTYYEVIDDLRFEISSLSKIEDLVMIIKHFIICYRKNGYSLKVGIHFKPYFNILEKNSEFIVCQALSKKEKLEFQKFFQNNKE